MTTADPYFFVCDCEELRRSACRSEIFYKTYDGLRYCVLHYPGTEKHVAFQAALARKEKAQDFDFGGVWFPYAVDFSQMVISEANFGGAVFNSAVRFRETEFGEYATFGSAQFVQADFSRAKFIDADFGFTKFNEANFLDAQFEDAYFANAEFIGDAKFNPAIFLGRASFSNARFGRAFFGNTDFSGGAYFGNAKFGGLADFGDVKFGGPNFEHAQFVARVNFGRAEFSASPVFVGVQFDEVDFSDTTFTGDADFKETKFRGSADFGAARLKANAFFNDTEFEKNAYFNDVKFLNNEEREGIPPEAIASSRDRVVAFDKAKFKDAVAFGSVEFDSQVNLRFMDTTFEQPDRVSFQDVNLRPIWFASVDPRPLHFIKVHWNKLYRRKFIAAEIKTLEDQGIDTPYESLEIVCGQLAVNAEENSRYGEAARFRFIANKARSRGTWHNLIKNPSEWESWINLNPLLWIYGFVSGYGERAWQAALVLVSICFIFAAIFYFGQRDGVWWRLSTADTGTSTADQPAEQKPILRDFKEAVIYSAAVLTLQKPEPLPANKRAKTFVLLETVLGPIQAALLALAIRRKFMR
jgi:uncharacterized protein YjbI with pentapeptide repeats